MCTTNRKKESTTANEEMEKKRLNSRSQQPSLIIETVFANHKAMQTALLTKGSYNKCNVLLKRSLSVEWK